MHTPRFARDVAVAIVALVFSILFIGTPSREYQMNRIEKMSETTATVMSRANLGVCRCAGPRAAT